MNKKVLLSELDKTVSNIIKLYKELPNIKCTIDENRTAKDVLDHIVFWHESFARNTFDVFHNIKPKPLKGSYSNLSEQCKAEMKNKNLKELIIRLINAQKIIQENILDESITKIPYRVGSRDYTPEEHLDIVNNHLLGHFKEVKEMCDK